MDDVKRDQYLFQPKNSKNWYYRRRWPKDVAKHLGQSFFKRALGTSDIKEARRMKSVVETLYWQKVEVVEAKLASLPERDLTESDILAIVQRWFAEAIDMYRKRPERSIEAGQQTNLIEDTRARIETLKKMLGRGDYSVVSHLAKELIQRENLRVDVGGPIFKQLCYMLLRGQIELYRMAYADYTGDYSYSPKDEIFRYSTINKKNDKTVGELIQLYREAKEQDWSPTAGEKYTLAFRCLKEMIGEKTLIKNIGREDFEKIKRVLCDLPPNYSTKKALTGLGIVKAAQEARRKGMPVRSPKTINDDLRSLSAIFNYAENAGWVSKNLARGLSVKDEVPSNMKKLPFSNDDLKAIFSPSHYIRPKNIYASQAHFWLPLIALYQGMRIGEICQLLVSDVRECEGIPCIIIGYDPDNPNAVKKKRVKTKAANRRVPVHPELIRMGFLTYVEHVRTTGTDRIFSELKPDKKGYFSSDWFTKLLRSVGIDHPRKTFYSFRHNYRDALRRIGASHDIAYAIGGWEREKGAGGVYGGNPFTPAELLEEIKKVNYPSLDLTHLYVEGE